MIPGLVRNCGIRGSQRGAPSRPAARSWRHTAGVEYDVLGTGYHDISDTVNADVLQHFTPGFNRGNFVDIIQNSDWPE